MLRDDELKAGVGVDASNSVSESLHLSSMLGIEHYGTICIDHSAAEGQTRSNNDFGRGHRDLVTGKRTKNKVGYITIGSFHELPPELKESLIQWAREYARRNKQDFDLWLNRQKALRRKKEVEKLEKEYADATEDYIVAIYFFEQYSSPRCWKTVTDTREEYGRLSSESPRLEAVKEQILIRYLGLGWSAAHHPWSTSGREFSSNELLEHLVNVVIPLAKELEVPPVALPAPPEMIELGTTSELGKSINVTNSEKMEKFKADARLEIEQRESRGEGGRWSEMQKLTPPLMNKKLVGFRIEMLFSYYEEDGAKCLNWYQGTVKKMLMQIRSV